MPEGKTISIHGYELEVPQPYAEGHTLTAIEAKALNQTFAENIGNNQRTNFKKVKDGEMDEGEARSKFSEYATNYKFTEASVGAGRSTATPLEKEAKRLARDVVISMLRASNRSRKDVSKEAFDGEVARIAETDQVQKAAAKNIRDAEKLAASIGGEQTAQ